MSSIKFFGGGGLKKLRMILDHFVRWDRKVSHLVPTLSITKPAIFDIM